KLITQQRSKKRNSVANLLHYITQNIHGVYNK
ncbi:MAG: hypothetical protein ACI9FO_001528, partial [Methylophagaceae bacterium]